ncbi:TPA: ead/Ea22-like family protein [Enterobacter cloacae]|nr:ead/Ea22-like family protein [Enterobacter cloacae]
MSNIDKRALREAAEKASTDNHTQDEWFHYLRCSTPETVLALLDEMEASRSENERLAKTLTERNGEPVEELVKRVAELEEIATDYGMKFQRAQDALKQQSLLHKSQLETAEKRIAELSHHLQCAHVFIEHTEAFGHEASNGILCCGDAQWDIDASKSALAADGKGE